MTCLSWMLKPVLHDIYIFFKKIPSVSDFLVNWMWAKGINTKSVIHKQREMYGFLIYR